MPVMRIIKYIAYHDLEKLRFIYLQTVRYNYTRVDD